MRKVIIASIAATLGIVANACSTSSDSADIQASSYLEGATSPSRLGQVDVDFSAAIPGSPSMTGILHGLGASTSVLPPGLLPTHVNPLRPALWRVGRQDTLPQMLGAGTPRIMFVLPEILAADGRAWHYADSQTDYDNTPGTTWCAPSKTATAKCLAQWDTHLKSVAIYLRTLAASYPQTLFYVDAWNEPDYGYPYVVKPHDTVTSADIDEVGEFMVKVIKDVRNAFGTVPANVRIGGPSFAYHSSLGSFQRALSNSLEGGLLPADKKVDYLTWHELDGGVRLEIANHARGARAMFAPLGVSELIVNEFVGPLEEYDSNAVLHAMRLLEDGGVSSASRACWSVDPNVPSGPSNCFNGTLDGLLSPDFQRRSVWYATKAYADGASSRVSSSIAPNPSAGPKSNAFVLASRPTALHPWGQVLFGSTEFVEYPVNAPPVVYPRKSEWVVALRGLRSLGLGERVHVRVEQFVDAGAREGIQSPYFDQILDLPPQGAPDTLELGTDGARLRLGMPSLAGQPGPFRITLSAPDEDVSLVREVSTATDTFNKAGNNGTVSCSTFCKGSQWGQTGACVRATRTDTNTLIGCSEVPGFGANPTCACAAGARFKHGNNGTVSCSTFCGGPQWGESGKCVGAMDTQGGGALDCSTVRGLGGAEVLCSCAPSLIKHGNNGTVSCARFCEDAGFGRWAGSCTGAVDTATGAAMDCSAVRGLGVGEAACSCATPIAPKHGNNGTVSCSTFCAESQWGGWSGVCLDGTDSRTNSPVDCGVTPGLFASGELSCRCRQL